MSTAKKFELAPDEVYIQQALKDGRAAVMEVSMKALGTPDVAFQARVKHLDMDHVYRLRMIFDQEGRLAPVVIFRTDDPANLRMILADGFHRHEVYRKAEATAIRAYVITVPADQLEHEARMFAAMCNQQLSLGRTPQDVRKAVEILFTDPECWKWTTASIARHCGLSESSVKKYRHEYSLNNSVNLPYMENSRATGIPKISFHNRSFRTKIQGKTIHGRTPEDVKAKIVEHQVKSSAERCSLSLENIRCRLMTGKIISEICIIRYSSAFDKLSGIITPSAVMVATSSTSGDAILKALGTLRLLIHYAGMPDARRIVVCYSEEYPAVLLDLARKDGVEFLTPDELVTSLKGEKDNLPGQPVITTSHTDGTTMINIT
jgi:hypothetical protein